MKQCPQCRRSYSDESLNYCLDDGAVLLDGPGSSDTATLIIPDVSVTEPPDRQFQGRQTTKYSTRNLLIAGVAGIILVALVLSSYYWFTRARSVTQINSVAVMPFINESGDAEIEYLSDGMTESLINSLSELPNLTVKARSSVFRFKGKDTDSKTIGTQLGVQALVNGRLVKHGDDLTVYIEVVEPQTGNRTWGNQYNRKIADLISLQSEIARDISNKLKTKLSVPEQQRLAKNYTTNVEAYQLYLKGRFQLFKLTPAGIQTGIAYFQQAIDIDPNYALAYVGIAAANRAFVLSTDMPPREFFPRAKSAALKAVEIDDDLAEAHAVLGFTIFWYDWDWAAAEKEFRRALELNPNSADAHWGFAHLYSNTGRHDEALAEIRAAREIDPLSLIISASEGLYLIDAGRPDEGLAQLQKTLELEPNYWFAHMFASVAYCDKKMYNEAVSEARKAKELNPASTQPTAFLSYALSKSGREAEARALIAEMIKPADGHYVPPYHIALAYAGLGDREQVLDWLERGIVDRDPKMTFVNVDNHWNDVRNDPRFEQILKEVGF
jgi:TolB-like protein/Tfp pilus assembly protein PilF